jgi:hypothetical protein
MLGRGFYPNVVSATKSSLVREWSISVVVQDYPLWQRSVWSYWETRISV